MLWCAVLYCAVLDRVVLVEVSLWQSQGRARILHLSQPRILHYHSVGCKCKVPFVGSG
jgi:hypothetical protein